MSITVPPLSSAHIVQFCNEVVPHSSPLYIDYRPVAGAPMKECFPTVAEYVAHSGGSTVTGWAIWEWPHAFVEAEFHAVWMAPDGTMLDLTPRPLLIDQTLFLPDPASPYEGRQRDNIRKALVRDRDVIRFLYIFRRRFEILNKGPRAYQHGEIELSNLEMKEMRSLQKEVGLVERRLLKRFPPRT